MAVSNELRIKRFEEFMKNNPGFSGDYPKKLQKEIEEEGLTHYRENLIADYFPHRLPPTLGDVVKENLPEYTDKAQSLISGLLAGTGKTMSGFLEDFPHMLENITGGLFDARDEGEMMRDLMIDHKKGQLATGGQNPYEDIINTPPVKYQAGGPVLDRYGYFDQPTVDQETAETPNVEDLSTYFAREIPEVLSKLQEMASNTATSVGESIHSGAETGYRSLIEWLTKPEGFQGSQPEGMSYAEGMPYDEGDGAHDAIDSEITVNTLKNYLVDGLITPDEFAVIAGVGGGALGKVATGGATEFGKRALGLIGKRAGDIATRGAGAVAARGAGALAGGPTALLLILLAGGGLYNMLPGQKPLPEHMDPNSPNYISAKHWADMDAGMKNELMFPQQDAPKTMSVPKIYPRIEGKSTGPGPYRFPQEFLDNPDEWGKTTTL